MEGIQLRDLPVVEDPDCYGYFRPEGDGLLVGLFEPVAAPWSLDRACPPGRRFDRCSPPTSTGSPPPSTEPWPGSPPWPTPVFGKFFYAAKKSSAFGVHPLLGPAPELDNYFVAAGLNSLGILLRRRRGNRPRPIGSPTVSLTGRRDGIMPSDRTAPHESTRAFRKEPRPPSRGSGCCFGGRGLPVVAAEDGAGGMRRSVLHGPVQSLRAAALQHIGRLGVRGVVRGVTSTLPLRPGFGRPGVVSASWPKSARAVRDEWGSWT